MRASEMYLRPFSVFSASPPPDRCALSSRQARIAAFAEHLRRQDKAAIASLADGFQLALLPPTHGGVTELTAVFLGEIPLVADGGRSPVRSRTSSYD